MSKFMTTIALVIMLLVGFGIGFVTGPAIMPSSTVADPVWDNIVATGVIKVGTDPTWPPYEQIDDEGNIVGFEVDIANAIAEELDLTIEWSSESFDAIIPSIQAKTLDLGVSGFSVTSSRLEVVQFTMPHSTTRGQVIMLESKQDSMGITTVSSIAELKNLGLTVGTQTGTTMQDELDAEGVENRAFNDFGLAMTDMVSANPSVDCVYAETPITSSWIGQYAAQGINIVVIYEDPSYYPVAFVANKDAHTLLAKVDGALADIIASGQLDALRTKWNA